MADGGSGEEGAEDIGGRFAGGVKGQKNKGREGMGLAAAEAAAAAAGR